VTRDGAAALCHRVESAKRVKEAGWLHRLRDDPWRPSHRAVRLVRLAPAVPPRPDLATLAASYRAAADPDRLHGLAASLGLSDASLRRLGVGWSAEHRAWSFPMTDPAGTVLGIRLRRPDGFKFAVTGGREGLFLPEGLGNDPTSPLLVCERPTDTAALLDMGFPDVAGRPSCTGGVRHLIDLARRRSREVVVVGDGDAPGRRGAEDLASVLVAYAPAVRVIVPPCGVKDARQWLAAGGDRVAVTKAIDAAPARRLVVRARSGGQKE
jgi:hypothetical protein